MVEPSRSFFRRLVGESAGDSRRWQRHEADDAPAINICIENGPPLTGRVQNISRGGLRFSLDRPIPPGAIIRVDLPPADCALRGGVLACVVHVWAMSADRHAVGCRFATELDDASLAALGARRAKPKNGDSRNWERTEVVAKAAYGRIVPPDESRDAEVHNLSPSGIALWVSEELAPGTLLDLRLADASDRPVLSILACVVYLKGGDGRWLAGCNFVRELDASELRAVFSPRD